FGLYRDDCRFLSGHELRVGGAPPRLLVAAAPTATTAVHELTAGEALRVRVAARGSDGVERAVSVTADPAPAAIEDGRLRFALDLQPGESADIALTYALHEASASPPRRAAAPARGPLIATDSELFDRVLERS